MRNKFFYMGIALGLSAAFFITACATGPSKTAYEGAGVGAATGAVAGALLNSGNRWQGGVIGGALGAVLGGALGEISNRAAHEAAAKSRPVQYTNQAGTQRVEAHPAGWRGNCHIVKEKYYEHGQLVKETERQVCN